MWEKLTHSTEPVDLRALFLEERYVAESRARCAALKVERDFGGARTALRGASFAAFTTHHAHLRRHAHRLFQYAYQSLQDKSLIFILTDDRGHVISMYSQPRILHVTAKEIQIRPGTHISEETFGTNAVSLSLRHAKPALVSAKQHYCRMFHNWTCFAIPILGSYQRIEACLDLSLPSDHSIDDKLTLMKFISDQLRDVLHVHKKTQLSSTANDHLRQYIDCIDLTSRQRQVLVLFSDGLSYKQIASRLGLNSIKTVEEHIEIIRKKLGAQSRRQCIRKAAEYGLLWD